MVILVLRAGYPRVTHPFATKHRGASFDLHVLGTPPAFILSQDQTLHKFMFCLLIALIFYFFFLFSIHSSSFSFQRPCALPSSGVLLYSTTCKLRLSTTKSSFLIFSFSVERGTPFLGATFIILTYLKLKVNTFDNKI